MKKKIITIILARGGSKGLKKKNLRLLNKKPLIYYPIKASLMTNQIQRTFVSTDDYSIRDFAINLGAEVPFLRPKKYSKDSSTSEDAICYFLKKLENKLRIKPDYVVYLQCTEPFRSKSLISRGIKKIIKEDLDSVFAVTETHKNFWSFSKNKFMRINYKNKNFLPRQKKIPCYIENTGLFLISKLDVFLSQNRIGKKVGFIEENENIPFVDIHNLYDLNFAEIIFKNLKSIYGKDIYNSIVT